MENEKHPFEEISNILINFVKDLSDDSPALFWSIYLGSIIATVIELVGMMNPEKARRVTNAMLFGLNTDTIPARESMNDDFNRQIVDLLVKLQESQWLQENKKGFNQPAVLAELFRVTSKYNALRPQIQVISTPNNSGKVQFFPDQKRELDEAYGKWLFPEIIRQAKEMERVNNEHYKKDSYGHIFFPQ